MNPLDQAEFGFFLKNIINEMPQHSPDFVRIPNFTYGHLPKDFMECSSKFDNKFLNNHLATVEEIQYRNQKHPIPKWFRDYQVMYFSDREVLAHDNFFNARLRDGFRKHINPNLTEVRVIGFFPYTAMSTFSNPILNRSAGGTPGSDLESGTGATLNGSGAGLEISKTDTTGTVGHLYDRVAASMNTASGNHRLGIYSDSSGPDVLEAETGSLAVTADYAWQTVTEFDLTTATNWLAWDADNTSCEFKYKTGYSSGDIRYKTYTYGALPNPAGAGYTSDTYKHLMKMGHS